LHPIMFIGSSGAHLDIATALAEELSSDVDARVWDRGVFGLASSTIDDLCAIASQADLAAFIFGADDVALLKDNLHMVTRDNVVFELGMFIGALDRARSFFVIPRDSSALHVPTDLAGVTAAHFDPALKTTDSRASVRGAGNAIRSVIVKLRAMHALSGQWIHRWTAPDGGEHQCAMDLLQLGKFLRAAYKWGGLNFELRGKIDGRNLVTAQYRCLNGDHGYSGTLHMVLNPSGRAASGQWAGWSFNTSPSGVNTGACNWERVADRG